MTRSPPVPLIMVFEVAGAAPWLPWLPGSAAAPVAAAPAAAAPAPVAQAAAAASDFVANDAYVHASPAVRRLAREFGVNLAKVKASGRKGRIVKEDVQAYGRMRSSARVPLRLPAPALAAA